MKKKLAIIVSIIIVLLIIAIIIFLKNMPKNSENQTEALKFKEEYEKYNGQNNKSDAAYKKIEVKENNKFVYADMEKVKEIVNGTGVIYFGFPECPWCRNAVPVIDTAAKRTGVQKVYYINVYDIRDEKKLDENGDVLTTKEGTKEYNQLLEILNDFLTEYKGLNRQDIKRIYAPTVMTFKDGQLVDSHISTVESQKDPYVDLTVDQSEELLSIYIKAFSQISDACSSEC